MMGGHGHSHGPMTVEEDEEDYDDEEDDYDEPDGTVACCGSGGCCGGGDDEDLPFPPILYQYFPQMLDHMMRTMGGVMMMPSHGMQLMGHGHSHGSPMGHGHSH